MDIDMAPTSTEISFLKLMGFSMEGTGFASSEGEIYKYDSSRDAERFYSKGQDFVFKCGDSNIIFYRDSRSLEKTVIIEKNGISRIMRERYTGIRGFRDRLISYQDNGKNIFSVGTKHNQYGGTYFNVNFNSHHSNINCRVNEVEHFRAADHTRDIHDLGGLYFIDNSFIMAYDDEIEKDFEVDHSDVKEFAKTVFPLIHECYRKAYAIPVIYQNNFYQYLLKESIRISRSFDAKVEQVIAESKKAPGKEKECLEKIERLANDRDRLLENVDKEKNNLDNYIEIFTSNQEYEKRNGKSN